MLGVALGIPRLGRKRSSIVNSVSRVIITMSGWKDDPILLSSSSSDEGSVASSADLNDDQFELVKARFNALRPQYEDLWRSMLTQNKENTPSGGAAKDSDNVTAADAEEVTEVCCNDDCNCLPKLKSFVPPSILAKSEEQEKFFDLKDTVQGTDQVNGTTSEQSSIASADLSQSAQVGNKDEGIGKGVDENNKSSGSLYSAGYMASDDSEKTGKNQESDSDEEQSSDVSTVFQWDSWSDPKDENVNSNPPLVHKKPPEVILTAKMSISPLRKDTMAVPKPAANFESSSEEGESLHSVDSTRSKDDEKSLDDSFLSESEAEWDGDLNDNTQKASLKRDIDFEDLIQRTSVIEILDSSEEDELVARPKKTPSKPSKNCFRKVREKLANKIFEDFDQMLCQGRLAETTTIAWSNTLNKTAGQTRLKRSVRGRTADIELATKVVDDEERLRSTLVHELCHAAAFVVDDVAKPPHGDVFKRWGRRAMNTFTDVEVTTTHDYIIQYSHFWTCAECSYTYKRHSKSIDTQKHRCGRCKGKLFISLEDGTPKPTRAPSAYQQFIQKKSAAVRKTLRKKNKSVSQAEVMRECARLWKEQKEALA